MIDMLLDAKTISIHTLTQRVTNSWVTPLAKVIISIHTLTQRVTGWQYSAHEWIGFQSTPSRRG